MSISLYLLWSTQGWGIFTESTCPDPCGVIPPYCYRKYEFKNHSEERKAFNRLLEVKAELVENKIVPNIQNHEDIFPDISTLLK